jgi:hypothetical protein
MATKPQNTVYRTAKGAQIDMLKLINQNELTPAVGNAGVNARGDKLGPGGKIIKKREDLEMVRNKDTSGMDPEGNE